MEILITALAIAACILLFSFAIFIHEFGHFLAAKLLGFKVDVFSIGFGPALWKKTWRGVEYRISAIPFGGYVALPQLDPAGTAGVQGSNTGEA
ncbi:MAG: site-2 protease family protein, partial [Kiritimatiellae bacterium]|nr:site-2 protease family protein [Kiritimatiellia bacterium]